MSDEEKWPEWMKDDLVRNIPREKLDFLNTIFEAADQKKRSAGRNLSQKEMLMQFMPLLKQMKTANLSFTPQEMQAAVAAIKKYSSTEELKEIDKILAKNTKQ